MQEIKFRTLKAEEIECRPAMVKDGKATILLYISSRAVVRLLNETVGPMNWTMEFEEVNGQLVGKMGIWDENKNNWVYKCDTGSESNIEKQKGLFSDCYKRCLSRWGVDELYSAPKIVIPDDGYGCGGYRVSYIDYNDKREIIRLMIVNRFGKTVFDYVDDGHTNTQVRMEEVNTQPVNNTEILRTFCGSIKANADKNQLKRFWEFYSKKTEGWKGVIQPDKLWKRWLTTAA